MGTAKITSKSAQTGAADKGKPTRAKKGTTAPGVASAGIEGKQIDYSDYRKLRDLPTLDETFGKELTTGMKVFNRRRKVEGAYEFGSALPVDPAITAVTEQWWPEIFDSIHGGCVTFEPEAGQKLEQLCKMFGVPLRLKTSSVAVISHAYDIFVQTFDSAIRGELELPGFLRKVKEGWEPEWVEYLEAVAGQRQADAQRLARQLGVLRSDAKYPPRTFTETLIAPAEMDAVLDSMWAIEDAKAR